MDIEDPDRPALSAEELAVLQRLDDELGPDPYAGADRPTPSLIEAPTPAQERPPVIGVLAVASALLVIVGLLTLAPMVLTAGAALGLVASRLFRREVRRRERSSGP
ncbi:MAG: hypothetical protein AAGA17_01015 [Actinomycetota bacterium]